MSTQINAGIIIIIISTVLNYSLNANFASGQRCSNNKVRFYLYNDPSNYNLESGKELELSNLNGLLNSNIARDKQIKFIIHGYVHNYTCWVPQEIKDTYFLRGYQVNLVAVDWGPLATPKKPQALLDYIAAVKNVPVAAKQIVDFIAALIDNNLISSLQLVHLIGFSLGAQVSGQVGFGLQTKYGQRIGRITGLDPAGPGFHTSVFARRLRKCDASYVDVIHTDHGRYGILGTAGHADFYPNGGIPPQPGCTGASCSHEAAPNYFLQSIGTTEFVACKCFTYLIALTGLCSCSTNATFGENSKPGTKGTFHLKMTPIQLSGRYTC